MGRKTLNKQKNYFKRGYCFNFRCNTALIFLRWQKSHHDNDNSFKRYYLSRGPCPVFVSFEIYLFIFRVLTLKYRILSSYNPLCFKGFRKISKLTTSAMVIKYQSGGIIYLSKWVKYKVRPSNNKYTETATCMLKINHLWY